MTFQEEKKDTGKKKKKKKKHFNNQVLITSMAESKDKMLHAEVRCVQGGNTFNWAMACGLKC